MTMPMAQAQRTETEFKQRPYVRGEERTWPNGKPPHVFAPDGSWISTVAGVNADGSFMGGRDPLTGLYWPGDAWVGNRPAYFDELGRPPYMDPDGIVGPRAKFADVGLTLETAPASAPVPVDTAPPPLPKTIIAGDDGSRAATFGPGDAIKPPAALTPYEVPHTPLPTPGAAFALEPDGVYLIDGTRKTGSGTVLNVDRTLAETVAGDASSSSAPQNLPTNNTTATVLTEVPPEWRKYMPYVLAALALLLVVVAMRRRSS